MAAVIKRPGWVRGALGAVMAGAFGFGLVISLRAISGLPIYQTEQTGYPQVIVPLITAPLGFLAGIGASTTGSTGPPAGRPAPRTTPATAPTAGATTSGSTPTTR